MLLLTLRALFPSIIYTHVLHTLSLPFSFLFHSFTLHFFSLVALFLSLPLALALLLHGFCFHKQSFFSPQKNRRAELWPLVSTGHTLGHTSKTTPTENNWIFCKMRRQKYETEDERREEKGCMMDRDDFWFCSRRLSSTPVADGWAVIVELFHVHLRWMDKQQCPFRCLSVFLCLDTFCCPHYSPTHTQGAHQIWASEYWHHYF